MPNLLENLELDELSLVDRPANAQAMVSLFKRDNSQEDKMTEEVTKKADNLSEEITKFKAENERLRKSLLDNGFVIKADTIEKKAPEEFLEYEGEKINKSDIPAPILKALEEAEVAKADVELTKRATEKLPHFAVDVAKALVAKFDTDEAVMQALAAADVAFSNAMDEVGKTSNTGDLLSAEETMDALVKTYISENGLSPKADYAKAYAAVSKTEQGKTLVNKIYQEGKI